MIPRWLSVLIGSFRAVPDAEPLDQEDPVPTDPPTADLDRALEKILAHEGGWSDHPADRGGETMYGVTHGTLERARRTIPGLPANIRDLTKDQARRVYEELYWTTSGAPLLPWPANYMQMDAAVQHGPARATRLLQEALAVGADGVIGPRTRAAISAVADWRPVVSDALSRRGIYYMRILADPQQAVFARGWANRMDSLTQVAREEV